MDTLAENLGVVLLFGQLLLGTHLLIHSCFFLSHGNSVFFDDGFGFWVIVGFIFAFSAPWSSSRSSCLGFSIVLHQLFLGLFQYRGPYSSLHQGCSPRWWRPQFLFDGHPTIFSNVIEDVLVLVLEIVSCLFLSHYLLLRSFTNFALANAVYAQHVKNCQKESSEERQ